ncbi:phosphonate C-P lyase system protein PhnH [Rhizobiaceae bacterium n13]|uniref:Phosphonate C-P lyase system protein PhnH n=1 Tax=Ferirhizobium litorale TaxID=2927786 RepID=A0AAE3QHC2_9HYPH|nr:phosphonate C-P lyase system protein PhnH [Fererhizobium litorale]MDI7862899.1 phosphonate C-P lyase system protein PhnH [Fererhizobium litorale]MDI7923985.1 phosphonate C-P lyase system protein PhnH [Fererhizobium litorale]
MTMKTEALTGGFAEPVHQAQGVFKLMMDGMARPGTIQTVGGGGTVPPAPLGIAAGAIALTLCDHDTPVWLSAQLASPLIADWLAFHTGATVTQEKAEARFAFIEAGKALSSFGLFSIGTQEYPDRSATIVIEIANFENGQLLSLSGPGILGTREIRPEGLPDAFLRLWADNRVLFPRGIDVVLAAADRFVCLPRTSKITVREI